MKVIVIVHIVMLQMQVKQIQDMFSLLRKKQPNLFVLPHNNAFVFILNYYCLFLTDVALMGTVTKW